MHLNELLRPGILMADPNSSTSLLSAIHQMQGSITILIGPEGGFTSDERDYAKEEGVILVRLGPRRLRAETAAICSASAVMLIDP